MMNTPESIANHADLLMSRYNISPAEQKNALEIIISQLRAEPSVEAIAAQMVDYLRSTSKFLQSDPDAFLLGVADELEKHVSVRAGELEQQAALEDAKRSILHGTPCDLSALKGNPRSIAKKLIETCVTHDLVGSEASRIMARTLLDSMQMTPRDKIMGNDETLFGVIEMLGRVARAEGVISPAVGERIREVAKAITQ